MKKLAVLITMVFICLVMKAQQNKDVCYVNTVDKVYFGQDVKVGLNHTRIISDDGTVAKIDNHDVKSYSHEGRFYELLPVVCEFGDTTCFALMQYVSSNSGMKLYRYNCPDPQKPCFNYFVFKNGKFYSRMDENNASETLKLFGIKAI